MRIDLQFFGGRGANSNIKRRFINLRGKKFGIGFGERIGTLKEALGNKGKAFNSSDALLRVNPNYNRTYAEYSMNCQRCVVAYELRRRGYDVEALPTYEGDKAPTIAYYNKNAKTYEGRWKGAFRNAKTINVGAEGNNAKAEAKVIKNIEKQMRGFKKGSRGVVQVLYRGGGGHVFNVENTGKGIVFYEAQTGKVKNMKSFMMDVDTKSVNLVRTDNLRISDRAKNFVTKRKKR